MSDTEIRALLASAPPGFPPGFPPAAANSVPAAWALLLTHLPAKPTNAIRALAALPPVRIPVCRAGRASNPASRPANLEAELGQFTGQIQAPGCAHCKDGFGVWTVCVVVAGRFGGACGNCHYGSEGARCSLRADGGRPPGGASASRPRRRSLSAEVAPPAKRRRLSRAAAPAAPAFHPLTGVERVARPALSAAARARRQAELFGELSALYQEEAEELEELEREEEEEEEEEEERSGGRDIYDGPYSPEL